MDDRLFDPERFLLTGQVALVTGAGSGIGYAIARVLAGAGASVVASDRDPDKAEAIAADLRSSGAKAIGVPCDVTVEADLQNTVDAALGQFGALTVLVNNAGGGGPKPFNMPMSDFRWAYELNVFAPFRLAQLAAPHLAAQSPGAIVNISSMAGENRNERMASYASSKAALNHLTRNIAYDLGPSGIRVNAIAPGAIKTRALASVLTPSIEQSMLRHTPLGRLGTPGDIAYAALFLCSPAASWISGQILIVSGGGVQELDE